MNRRLTGILCLGSCAWLFAQVPVEPPRSEPSPTLEKATGQEVLLDLIARDKKGRLVRDLSLDDFVISDNGHRVQVKSFQLIEGHTVRDAGNAEARGQLSVSENRGQRQFRLVSLVFDRLQQNGRTLARRAALDLLGRPLDPHTYMAVFAIEHRLNIVQPFTNDRGLLRAAVERATTLSVDLGRQTELIRSQLASEIGAPDDPHEIQLKINNIFDSPAQGGFGMDEMRTRFATLMLSILEFDRHEAAEQEGHATLNALMALVKDQYHLPGRKTVMYFAEGLKVPENLQTFFNAVIAAANRSNVSFYSIDARGLTNTRENETGNTLLSASTNEIRREQQAGLPTQTAVKLTHVKALDQAAESIRENTINPLGDLAQSTGDFLVSGSNDLRRPVQNIAEDIETYYEVSYDPQIQKYDGSFHKTVVAVLRPGVAIQGRSGYFALPGALNLFEQSLMRAVNLQPAPDAFSYSTEALSFRGEHGYRVGLVLDLPLSGITFVRDTEHQSYRMHLSALLLVKDATGEVCARFTKDVPSHGPLDNMDGVRASKFIYTESAVLPPGVYRLETAVVDLEGQRASVRTREFKIAEPTAGLAMSDIVIVRRTVEDGAAGPESESPFRYLSSVVVPTLDHTVSLGSKIPVFLTIYPDARLAQKPQVALELWRGSESVLELEPDSPEAAPGKPLQFYFTATTDGLDAGAYQLRATVKQGDTQITKRADVRIQPK